jgi:hypothetical protein
MPVEQEFGLTASVRGNDVRGSVVCTAALFDADTTLCAKKHTGVW